MTSFTELLDAPAGTVATTRLNGLPWTAVVAEKDGVRHLMPQHSNCPMPTNQLDDLLTQDRDEAPAVRQLHPIGAELLPVRPGFIEDDDESDAAHRRMVEALESLPVGTVIDASPAQLDRLGEVMILTRLSESEWMPLECGAPSVDDVRVILGGGALAGDYHEQWVRSSIVEPLRDADFEITAAAPAWAAKAA